MSFKSFIVFTLFFLTQSLSLYALPPSGVPDSNGNYQGNGPDGNNGNSGEGNQGNGVGNIPGGNQGNDTQNGSANGQPPATTTPNDNGNFPGNGPDGETSNSGGSSNPNNNSGPDGNSEPDGDGSNPDGNSNPSNPDNNSGPDGGSSSDDESDSGNDNPSENVQRQEQNQFELDWSPAFYLNFDSGENITRLTPYENGPDLISPPREDAYGYHVTKYRILEVGVGAQGYWHYSNATGLKEDSWGFIGLIPLAGQSVITQSLVKTLEEARSLPEEVTLPYHAEDLDHWAPTDSIEFNSSGGLVFFAGLGFELPVYAGVLHKASGNWKILIEKSAEYEARVLISCEKLTSFYRYLGASLISIGKDHFNLLRNGFSYSFNLRDPEDRKAYEDFVRGNIAGIQKHKALDSANFNNEQPKHRFVNREKGSLHRLSLGIPLLMNVSWSDGHVEGFDEKIYSGDESALLNYGIYVKQRQARAGLRKASKLVSFYGGAIQYKTKKGENYSYFGQLIWQSKADHSSSMRFQQASEELFQFSGLDGIFNVDYPNLQRHMGFAKHELKWTFFQSQTLRMMYIATSTPRKQLQEKMKELVENYFSNYSTDPLKVCRSVSDADSVYSLSCESQLLQTSLQATDKMLIALKKMASLHDKDRKEFTLTYAKYGQYFLTNPFTIRLGMLLAGKGSRLDYSIEGEKINRYLSSYKTTEEGQLKKVDSQRNENDDAIVESNNLNRGRALILGNEKPYIINGL